MRTFTWSGSLGLLFLLTPSCSDSSAAAGSLPKLPLGIASVEPMLITNPDNELTAAKAELGKVLFFDTRLSSDGSISCETCHLHDKAWTDGKQLSRKVDGTMNTRNSPTLYNLAFHPMLYWDGRAPSLEANIAAAWKGHMGGDPEAMAKTLAGIPKYAEMFQAAFGSEPKGEHIPMALASFVRTLYSGNSAWDRYEAGDKSAVSSDAIAGQQVFNTAGCVTCHTPPLYTDRIFHNTGVGMDAEDPDLGRFRHDPNEDPATRGAFKTPTLRAAAKSAPYFHDGGTATLEEAVRFMAGGGLDNPHRDPLLKDAKLNDEQIRQLVAFIQSLASNEPFTRPTLP